jgi:Ribonuclease G/E
MCGSGDLKSQRKRYRAVMLEYRLLRCQHCGANVRGNYEARQASTRGV